ncbi:MAG: MarR family transcriptional regulator [Spirochaetes bacterium]|nr:MarR family transcriptional regulator [Spirochaetota bacterium]
MRNKLCNLKEVFRVIYHFENKVKTITGHSINELLILCSLQKSRINPGILAEEMGISAGRISKILASLEKDKLITRELSMEDKRQMFFTITPEGIKKLQLFQNSDIEIPDVQVKSTGGNNE